MVKYFGFILAYFATLSLISISSHECPVQILLPEVPEKVPEETNGTRLELTKPAGSYPSFLSLNEHLEKEDDDNGPRSVILDNQNDLKLFWLNIDCLYLNNSLEFNEECNLNSIAIYEEDQKGLMGVWTVCPNHFCTLTFINKYRNVIESLRIDYKIIGDASIKVHSSTSKSSEMDLAFDNFTLSPDGTSWTWKNSEENMKDDQHVIHKIIFRIELDKNGEETSGRAFIERIIVTFKMSTTTKTHLLSIAISVSVVLFLMTLLVLVTCIRRRRKDDFDPLEEEEPPTHNAYPADELAKDGFAFAHSNAMEDMSFKAFPNDLMTISSVEFRKRYGQFMEGQAFANLSITGELDSKKRICV